MSTRTNWQVGRKGMKQCSRHKCSWNCMGHSSMETKREQLEEHVMMEAPPLWKASKIRLHSSVQNKHTHRKHSAFQAIENELAAVLQRRRKYTTLKLLKRRKPQLYTAIMKDPKMTERTPTQSSRASCKFQMLNSLSLLSQE